MSTRKVPACLSNTYGYMVTTTPNTPLDFYSSSWARAHSTWRTCLRTGSDVDLHVRTSFAQISYRAKQQPIPFCFSCLWQAVAVCDVSLSMALGARVLGAHTSDVGSRADSCSSIGSNVSDRTGQQENGEDEAQSGRQSNRHRAMLSEDFGHHIDRDFVDSLCREHGHDFFLYGT